MRVLALVLCAGTLALAGLTACIVGDGKPAKSPLHLMDGEQYSEVARVQGVPVVTRRYDPQTRISGKVLCHRGVLPIPVKQQQLHLVRQGDVVALATTDINGVFEFSGDLLDGRYWIEVRTPKLEGKIFVDVRGYAADDVTLVVHGEACGSS